MFDWFQLLDPTVQVAIIAPIIASLVAIPAWFRVHLTPKTPEKEKEFAPKPFAITLAEVEQLRMDRLIYVLESLADTVERHRQELAHLRYRPT